MAKWVKERFFSFIQIGSIGRDWSGCSYSSSYLAGRPMSQEQYELIRTSLNDWSIQKGMPYEEVDNLLGPAQRRVMNVWTYYAGSVNYLSGEGLGEKWQFNFTNGKLKSIYYFAPGIFGWRNVLKEDQPKAKD